LGLNRNRLDFNLNFQWQLPFPQSTYCPLFFISPRLLFRGRHPYSFQVVDQDRRYHLLKIAPSFPPLYFSSSIGSLLFHQPHIACFRISHWHCLTLELVQIRKAKFKVVQKSDHGRLTYLRKTQMAISRTVVASIHYIGPPVVGDPAYLSSLLLPFPRRSWTTRSVTSRCPLCAILLVPGTLSSIPA
jgi:hypothetical protein